MKKKSVLILMVMYMAFMPSRIILKGFFFYINILNLERGIVY